jgi:F-type H+-transporting ATPase subunit a
MNPAHEGAMSIGERITEAISIKVVFTIKLFGLSIPISDTVIMTWIVMALLFAFAYFATRKLREVPKGVQVVVEFLIEFADSFTLDNIGHHGKKYAPFIGSIFLFLLTANLLPMLTPIGGFGYEPAFVIKPLTRDVNITAAFAIVTMCVVIYSSFKYKGALGFAKSFVKPMAFMVPFNALEYVVKPLSLTLRLFGNILGAYIIMQLIEIVLPLGLPPIMGLYFDLFDGLIQAVVFTFLSTVYIAEAIE